METQLMRKQAGAALFTGIVFTSLITALAVTLLSNSVMDQKIAAANAELISSVDKTLGGLHEVVYKSSQKTLGEEADKDFLSIDSSDYTLRDNLSYSVECSLATELCSESSAKGQCERQKYGGDAQCFRYRISLENQYGKNNSATTNVEAGVEKIDIHDDSSS